MVLLHVPAHIPHTPVANGPRTLTMTQKNTMKTKATVTKKDVEFTVRLNYERTFNPFGNLVSLPNITTTYDKKSKQQVVDFLLPIPEESYPRMNIQQFLQLRWALNEIYDRLRAAKIVGYEN